MSGSLYGYSPWQAPRETPGQAMSSGFREAQEIDSRALRMDELRQMARMRELQEGRAAAGEARTAQRFPIDLQTAEQALQAARQTYGFNEQANPYRLTQMRLANQRAQQGISEADAVRRAISGMAAPPPPPGAGAGGAAAAPGGATPGYMAPAAPPPPSAGVTPPQPAATPGPQSSLEGRPAWLSPELPPGQRYERVGPMLASAGVSDYSGMPTGLTPGMLAPQQAPDFMGQMPPNAGAMPQPQQAPGLVENVTVSAPAPNVDPFYANVPIGSVPRAEGGRAPGGAGAPGGDPGFVRAITERQRLIQEMAAEQQAATPPTTATGGMTEAQMREATAGRGDQEETPAVPVTAAETAMQRGQEPSQPYFVQAISIEEDGRALMAARERQMDAYRIARASRNPQGMLAALEQINATDTSLRHINGMRTVIRFNSPRRNQQDIQAMGRLLYDLSNGQQAIQPNADGTFNIYTGGRLEPGNANLPPEQIALGVRTIVDRQLRAQMQATREREAARLTRVMQQGVDQNARASAEIQINAAKAALGTDARQMEVTLPDGNKAIQIMSGGRIIGLYRFVQLPAARRGDPPRIVVQQIYQNQ